MPEEDAVCWNGRYSCDLDSHRNSPRDFLVEHRDQLPPKGLALDVAMGLGANSAFLLKTGLSVVGMDISWEAVRIAKARNPGILALVIDLTQASLPPDHFDVIVNFYYLDRTFWKQYYQAIKPGGLLIIETLTMEMLKFNPSINPEFLLSPGELKESFVNWQIIAYREAKISDGEHHREKSVASMIARRPQ
jgi:SAM-dependent methyltransferase